MKIKTVCYELHNYFHTQPQHISVCPVCKTRLMRESTDPTQCGLQFIEQGIFPYVETTRSYCDACNWWCLREISTDFEASGTVDLLLTVLPEIDTQSEATEMETDNAQPPWDTIYNIGSHWKKSTITAEIVAWLWGAPLN